MHACVRAQLCVVCMSCFVAAAAGVTCDSLSAALLWCASDGTLPACLLAPPHQVYIWAQIYNEEWSAFAPDFQVCVAVC